MATTERTAAERPDAPAAGPAHLAQAIADRCRRLPEAPMVGGQERLRWQHLNGAQFLRRMHSLAEDLQARGVGRGDRVVLWVPNGWRTPVLFAAVWQLGAAVVPFDREMHVEAARTILRLVEPRLVITGYGQRPAWAPEPGDDPVVEEWWEPGTRAPEPVATAAIGAGDVAAIYFTSGTTGNPKGCTISHGNLLSQVAVMPSVVPVEPGDVFGSILPLSHLFELTCGMIYPLIRGACIEYIPSRKGPDIVRVLAEQHVSHMVAVPQVLALMGAAAEERLSKLLGRGRYEALLRLADRLPMRWRRVLFYPIHRRLGGRLAMIASGGAALDPAVQLLWERMGVRTIQGYGASECSPIIAAGRADGSTPYGTVGTPLPGVEVRLDAEGQLLARGPNVMRGYWKDPARTAQVLSSDGYYATGDICELDARGNIRIMGRAQELLVLPSGMNVWPEDVEEALRKQPGIKDAVAILAPNSAGGATLHAYLIPGGTPDDALLARSVAAANGTLAAHQRLATASWWPEEDFPRTNTLKVKRRLIPTPDALPGAQAAQGAAPVDVTASSDDPVLRAVRAVTNISAVRDEQTLAELGLDSLGTTGLTVELEATTGLTLPDGEVDPGMTVAALRRAVSALATGATSSADGGTTGEAGSKRLDEARTWQPPLWFYTRGRALRRLASPFNWLHRRAVQRVISLGAEHLGALEGGDHPGGDASQLRRCQQHHARHRRGARPAGGRPDRHRRLGRDPGPRGHLG